MSSCGIGLKKPTRSSFSGENKVDWSDGCSGVMDRRNWWRFWKMMGMGLVPGTCGKSTEMMWLRAIVVAVSSFAMMLLL